MREADIQSAIIRYLKAAHGAYVVRPITCSESGHPDILALIDGKFYGIEVKTQKGKLTELQRYRLHQIQRAGGIAIVARSLDDVKEAIQ